MKWIKVSERLPSSEGKYVVKTKSLLGEKKLETSFSIDENEKHSWSASNQEVMYWLDEDYDSEKHIVLSYLSKLMLDDKEDREDTFTSIEALTKWVEEN
jgi:hypothetical protein